jgi:hypothetical protein
MVHRSVGRGCFAACVLGEQNGDSRESMRVLTRWRLTSSRWTEAGEDEMGLLLPFWIVVDRGSKITKDSAVQGLSAGRPVFERAGIGALHSGVRDGGPAG